MTEPESHTISRRTVIGAAWAAPVAMAVIAVPAAAASEDARTLSLDVSAPYDYEGTTSFVIRVTNDSTVAIPAGNLMAVLPDAAGYQFNGFSGVAAWNYAPASPPNAISFAYNDSIAAGDTAGPLLLILDNTDSNQTTPPIAILTFTADGFQAASTGLSIVY